MHEELQAMYEADQARRQQDIPTFGTPEYAALVAQGDQERRRVLALLEAGLVQTPEDYYHAAMILHHGYDEERIHQAHELALAAAEAGHEDARWLVAATLDRWLMYRGLPQKYGTQPVTDGTRWRLWDVDPTTTDAERSEWGVTPLEEAKRWAEEIGTDTPDWPADKAPAWLKERLGGWYI
jgi:hypothetical protein